MLKGILQGCLLILISEEPMYGYSISQALTQYGFQDVPKGTIYPLLINMEKKHLIVGKCGRPKKDPSGNTITLLTMVFWKRSGLSINGTSYQVM